MHRFRPGTPGRLVPPGEFTADFPETMLWDEYGESICAFVSNVRLMEAHAALVEGDLPIKVLSRRLGCSHVNHFTRAFTRKIGYPPGSLRRGGRKDGA